jgi:hypothetical protein
MKIGVLILSSLLLLAFSNISAFSIDWNNPESQTVDQMISGGDQGTVSFPAGLSPTPSASRASQVGQKGKDILSTTIVGKLTTAASNPQESRNQTENQTTTTQQVAVNTTESIQTNVSAKPALVSGSWSFELTGVEPRTASLTLFQSKDAVFGTGNLDLDANTTLPVAASGVVACDKLNLDLVSLEKVNLYRLALTVSGESAEGSYTAFSPVAEPTQGSANGERSAA